MKRTAGTMRCPIRGFTLIEALTTVFVIGILTALAVPAFGWLLVREQVQNSSYDLSSALSYAREAAARYNNDVQIQAKTVSGSTNWQNGWQITDPNGNVLQQQSAYTKVVFASNYTKVVFNRAGRIDWSQMSAQSNCPTNSKITAPCFSLSGVGATNAKRCLQVDIAGRVNTAGASC
jgi:prepilin-type N-terminal cleavage/methylation domain-containing protein